MSGAWSTIAGRQKVFLPQILGLLLLGAPLLAAADSDDKKMAFDFALEPVVVHESRFDRSDTLLDLGYQYRPVSWWQWNVTVGASAGDALVNLPSLFGASVGGPARTYSWGLSGELLFPVQEEHLMGVHLGARGMAFYTRDTSSCRDALTLGESCDNSYDRQLGMREIGVSYFSRQPPKMNSQSYYGGTYFDLSRMMALHGQYATSLTVGILLWP